MSRNNLFIIINILVLFIPYAGAFQFISHLLIFVMVIINIKRFYYGKILLIYTLGFIALSINLILLKNDVFLKSYLISIIYLPLLIYLFPNRKALNYSLNIDDIILKVFLIYAALLWYQAIINWWTPESVGGIHGIIKGPHINAQLYLILSGFYLFKIGLKNKLFSLIFLITALLCDYNLATIAFIVTILIVFLFTIKIDANFIKYFILTLSVLSLMFVLLTFISEQRNYLFRMLIEVNDDISYSGKLNYIYNYFNDFASNNFIEFLIGLSPGNGGSRSALLLTGNYLNTRIPSYLLSEPYFVIENVYPYLYGVSSVTRGTINQPFSSLIAIVSEFGIFVAIYLLFAIYLQYRKFSYYSSQSQKFLVVFFFIWLILSHSLEFLPFIVLYHLLTISNIVK